MAERNTEKAGISEKVSYRGTSTSVAFARGVQLEDILGTVNGAKTFYKSYKREFRSIYSDTIF